MLRFVLEREGADGKEFGLYEDGRKAGSALIARRGKDAVIVRAETGSPELHEFFHRSVVRAAAESAGIVRARDAGYIKYGFKPDGQGGFAAAAGEIFFEHDCEKNNYKENNMENNKTGSVNFIEEIIEADLASGKYSSIITRFPPEPNGYLHIGHAKSICLNYYGTAVKYGGICNLRFDDTNPAKEEEEYVNSIIEDIKWLGWKGDIYYASDYFGQMYDCAVRLIKKGLAYVDDLTSEEMRELRGTLTEPGRESKNRNRSVEENLRLFEDMRAGRVPDGALTLRAKIDMKSPNINMRDPIIYRVLRAKHHRQGDKWCIYPMYDFAHPIEDAVENITHSICTLEFEDHRPLYDWVIDNGDFPHKPHQYEFARLNLTRTIMSKRYLKKLVDEGRVDGWDDPRMPTISGFRRRGYSPAAIRNFCEMIGVSKSNSEVDKAMLEFCAREELNLAAERAMAVLDPVELVLTNVPDGFREDCEFEYMPGAEGAKRNITLTKRLYIEKEDFMLDPPPKYHRLTVGGMVRLKGAYIVKCTGCKQNPDGSIKEVHAEIIEGTKSGQNSDIKVKGVIHWVSADEAVDIEVRDYDELLLQGDGTKKDFSERFNDKTLVSYKAKAEPYLRSAVPQKGFQFLRKGYYCLDIKKGWFNQIVGLKDTYKPQK